MMKLVDVTTVLPFTTPVRRPSNEQIAMKLTELVGNMNAAYLFAVLSFIGLFGVLGLLPPIIYTLVCWLSQTFIQLVFLPVLAVGQNVQQQKAEQAMLEQHLRTQAELAQIRYQLASLQDAIASLPKNR